MAKHCSHAMRICKQWWLTFSNKKGKAVPLHA
jgi:hypothetical protein